MRLPRFSARTQGKDAATLFEGRDLSMQLSGDGRLRELRRGVRARLRFNDADIPDLAAYNRFLGNGQVRLVSGTARLSGDVGLDTDGRIGQGTARLLGQGARLQLAGLDLRADTRVDGTLQRGDFRQRWFDLTGSAVELRNVQIDGRPGPQGWQGRLDVDEGRIDAQSPFQVDARARVAMSDAGPLL
ncbi:MAG TPA: hypothetical protein DCP40_04860, partial [Stenotrophomonas sp.]|nr:hypothetical protein [Stenotrophomonas sp.]